MKKIFLLFAAVATLASCNDNDNYTPGPEVAENCPGVYFLNDYDAQTIVGDEPTIQDTIWYELGREDASEAIDVPIVVESKADCIGVPESVHFDKGDSTAWLGLTYVGIKYGEESKFSLRIGDDYANPYTEKEGSSRLQASILRSQWVEVCDTLVMSSQSYAWPDQGCDLQRLEGMNRFRITNFLGSGNSIEFSFATGYDKNDVTNSKGELNPITNYYESGDYWYFTNGGEYTPWTPAGSSKEIGWMEFYKGATYTYLDLKCDTTSCETFTWGGKQYYCDYYNHYSCMAAWISYSDGTAGWDYLYFYVGYLKK